MRWIFCILLLASSILGQPEIVLSVSSIVSVDNYQRQSGKLQRHLTVEVGDSTKEQFDPSFTLSAWGSDCQLRVNLTTDKHSMLTATRETLLRNGADMTRLITSNRDHELFIRADDNFEWYIILKERPDTNVFTFPIQTKGLRFLYQDTLSDIEKADNVIRPDSVIASYDVKRLDGRMHNWNHRDGTSTEYTTGKFCHIYRLKAWDANGDTVWVDQFIDTIAYTYSVIVDAKWLQSAILPVIVDPTFGVTSIGASNVNLGAYAIGFNQAFQLYTATTGDVVTTMHVYTGTPGQNDRSMSLYDTATANGIPNNQLFTPTTVTTGSIGWHTATVSWALVNGQEYTIVSGGLGNHNYHYDSNADAILSRDNQEDPLPDPFTQGSTRVYEVSMYATFTEAGAEPIRARRRRLLMEN